MEKKVLNVILLLICLITLIGCPPPTNQTEKKAVMDSELAGTWVNDTTTDIKLVFNKYSLEDCSLISGGKTFKTFISTISTNQDEYLSKSDVNTEDKQLILTVSNVSDQKNSYYLVINCFYNEKKLKIKFSYFLCCESNKRDMYDEFKRLEKDMSGTYIKK